MNACVAEGHLWQSNFFWRCFRCVGFVLPTIENLFRIRCSALLRNSCHHHLSRPPLEGKSGFAFPRFLKVSAFIRERVAEETLLVDAASYPTACFSSL